MKTEYQRNVNVLTQTEVVPERDGNIISWVRGDESGFISTKCN